MINLLPKETIDKIAAGEVVERPVSVVKELCENSIDAGADAITIEIKDGGVELIRVTDNGYGIEPGDIETAFLRHATSKIKDENDLLSLHSLGFRGEALASIAAVSKLELITKTANEMLGVDFKIEGGETLFRQECAAPEGSSFFIRELFYNTPARRKFLKGKNAENAAIEELIEELALSSPGISFRLTCEGKERVFTSGSGDLRVTIFEIFGKNTAENLLDIKAKEASVSVSGYIGTPGLAVSNRSSMIFFVNGRFVKSDTLTRACERGYLGRMMQHGFPFCVLNLSFPGGSTDVNVHPSKLEVRFTDPLFVGEFLARTIEKRLEDREDIVDVRISEQDNAEGDPGAQGDGYCKEGDALCNDGNNILKEDLPLSNNSKGPAKGEPFERKSLDRIREEVAANIESPYHPLYEDRTKNTETGEQVRFVSPEGQARAKVLGQVFGTYWIMELDGTMYILDQHAAHEKVLFERTMERIRDCTQTSQLLTPPIIVSLTPTQEADLNKNMESFEMAGYSIEHFGGKDYKITGIPFGLPCEDPGELLIETIGSGFSTEAAGVTERVASMSCKAAVKGNTNMGFSEINALLADLLTLKDPYHCPHGRPTMISFSRYELDKKFKRVV